MKTPLSSQVGNLVLIDAFDVLSRVLYVVFFLRASCCFPAEKKNSLYPASRCRATMALSAHPQNDIRVSLVDMSVSWQTPMPIVKDDFLKILVIRDVRNRVFFLIHSSS
jgi:hypothetical protein